MTFIQGAIDNCGRETVEMSIGDSNLSSTVGGGHMKATTLPTTAVTLSSVLAEHHIGHFVPVSDIEGAEAGLLLCEPPHWGAVGG